MVILGPLLMPTLVQGLGMHPIQFGMFLMVGLLLGLLTPPVGLCLFITAPIARVSLGAVSIACLPFVASSGRAVADRVRPRGVAVHSATPGFRLKGAVTRC